MVVKEAVKKGQSIWDLAVEHMGAPEGVAQLIQLNPAVLNFETTPTVGALIIIGEVIDQKVVDAFKTDSLYPATAVDIEDEDTIDGSILLETGESILLEDGNYLLIE